MDLVELGLNDRHVLDANEALWQKSHNVSGRQNCDRDSRSFSWMGVSWAFTDVRMPETLLRSAVPLVMLLAGTGASLGTGVATERAAKATAAINERLKEHIFSNECKCRVDEERECKGGDKQQNL